jgi:hypothetical protein
VLIIETTQRKKTTLSKHAHALAVAPDTETSNGAELRDATFASLEGHACTEAAQALIEAVNEQVLQQLSRSEAEGAAKTNRRKLRQAIGAFLADLLLANGKWVFRSLKKDGFTGAAVGARVFLPLQRALRELGLVEYQEGVNHWFGGFDEGGPELVSRRWASRYRPADKLLALAGEHGISLENALDHFDHGLPKQPLQKRAANTRVRGRKVQGRILKFEHTDLSRKLEADVRELNEYLAKQTFGGGCIHRGYVRIFQNGDDQHFNWDRGGRLYSQPADGSYQQESKTKRLEMTINGLPVVEIDLRASYLTIFHAWHGVQLDREKDPYIIPELGEEARDVVKLWVAATFGSDGPLRKWPTELLRNYEEEHRHPLDRKRYPVDRLRELIIKHHPLLGEWGQPLKDGRVRTWADLMFDESRIVVAAMQGLMRDDVPSLAVHDSLIVPEQYERKGAMALIGAFGGHFRVGHIPMTAHLKINSRQGSHWFVP